MKIGYFVNHFPFRSSSPSEPRNPSYYCGGAENAAYELAVGMAKKGHEVYVFTTSADKKFCEEQVDGLTVFRYGTHFKCYTANISLNILLKPKDFKADIIHTHFDMAPWPMAGWYYANHMHIPLILTYHGDWGEWFGGWIRKMGVSFHNKYLVDRMLQSTKVIISPSTHFLGKSRFLRKYSNKVVVIPNGVNIQEYQVPYSKEECRCRLQLPVDSQIVLFVGDLNPYKAPDVLLGAFSRVIKDIPHGLLIFVGGGVLRTQLEGAAEDLGTEHQVIFTGFIEDISKKSLYYHAADIFCLSSISECLPLVVLEAMASGVPVIASAIGGIPDVIQDGKNGILLTPGDPDVWAQAITDLLKDEEARKRISLEGKHTVEAYSWEKVCDHTEKVYEECLARS